MIKYIVNSLEGGTRVIFNENEYCIEMNASELCHLVSRASDLDSRAPSNMNIQSKSFDVFLSQLPDYDQAHEPVRALCSLHNTAQINGNYYTVSAVADRAYRNGEIGIVDRFVERRFSDGSAFPDNYDIALLKTNAYFYASKNSLSRVNTRIIFCFKDTKKIKIIEDSFTVETLRRDYFELLEKADFFGKLMLDRKNEILPRARRVPFPYTEIREGQEKMIKTIYRGIVKEKNVFVQAPTGIGKTISSLYPAIRAMSEGRVDRIFYLTAKAQTRREAWSAMKKLHSAGAKLKSIVISAKDSTCVCPKKISSGLSASNFCNSFDCEFARGYYDRVNGAIRELVENYSGYTQGLIAEVAKKYRVCPYELSLDLSLLCDVIICDYNYIFDPIIYFQRYFGDEGERGRYVFLIDEAHNLPDRAIDMYSATLSKNEIEAVASVIPPYDSELLSELDGFIRSLEDSKKLCYDNMFKTEKGDEQGYYISKNSYSEFEERVDALHKVMGAWIRKNKLSPALSAVKSLYADIAKYKKISELYDERYMFFIEVAHGDVKVRLSCLDPSHQLSLCHSRAVSSIMFSATLEPIDYFSDILGGDKSSIKIQLPSPFKQENLCLACVDSINTRFEEREKSYKIIASSIAGTVSGRAGNYIVFFPSYKYMNEVRSVFEKKYPKVKVFAQSGNMTYTEKEEFLSNFKEDTGVLRVGFCVLGGSFSEGIDLPGTRLIGTIIVGVGLPGISSERNIMKEYFENTREGGYDYAYTYPGMNRVLQAAGRVIRTESDRGVVVLLDDRYATEQYKMMFPMQWSHAKYVHSAQELAGLVKEFWKEN